jgi:tetratricopeptide (TPR) repeat protein
MDTLAKAQSIDGGFVWIYVYRGNVYLKQGQPAKAIPEYEHALQIQPDQPEAFRYLQIARQMLAAQPH